MKKLALFVCLMILATIALSSQQLAEKCMCEKKVKALQAKVLEMWNTGNLELIAEFYNPAAVVQTSTTPEPFVGLEGIKKWVTLTRTMLPDMVMTFEDVIVQPDRFATIWTITGTQNGPMQMPGGMFPATGKKVRFTGLSFDYLKDGKKVREIVIYNVIELLMQLGFTLQPPAPPPPAQ